jgi:adenylyltransferase/sulfurtransferase
MRTNDLSVSFMKKGSAVLVGPKDENDAILLYKSLLDRESTKTSL